MNQPQSRPDRLKMRRITIQLLKYLLIGMLFMGLAGVSAYVTLAYLIGGEDAVPVPDLRDKEIVQVLELLTGLGFNTRIKGLAYDPLIPRNHVISQDPEAGYELKKGRDVFLVLSRGTQEVLMPDLIGQPLRQARLLITENGLSEGKISRVFHKTAAQDEVIAHWPRSGMQGARGASVDLLVSRGPRPLVQEMPDYSGLTLPQALFQLEADHLTAGEILFAFDPHKAPQTILKQEPLAGYPVNSGATVQLTVNHDPDKAEPTYGSGVYPVHILHHREEPGFLKNHLVINAVWGDLSITLFDDFVRPDQETWLLVPVFDTTAVTLYKNDQLVQTSSYGTP